ncbi:hypothetical protein [Candidatus Protochlamydia phocaeensis]|uniref:hypothetical protein n=1 Tax=Candidatus Protochlamydia phocaeensis TaxID=1414722 RepID=UPI000839A465|nr:hypothetical protein [Candidatus Protochlamydia phocaeensis]
MFPVIHSLYKDFFPNGEYAKKHPKQMSAQERIKIAEAVIQQIGIDITNYLQADKVPEFKIRVVNQLHFLPYSFFESIYIPAIFLQCWGEVIDESILLKHNPQKESVEDLSKRVIKRMNVREDEKDLILTKAFTQFYLHFYAEKPEIAKGAVKSVLAHEVTHSIRQDGIKNTLGFLKGTLGCLVVTPISYIFGMTAPWALVAGAIAGIAIKKYNDATVVRSYETSANIIPLLVYPKIIEGAVQLQRHLQELKLYNKSKTFLGGLIYDQHGNARSNFSHPPETELMEIYAYMDSTSESKEEKNK